METTAEHDGVNPTGVSTKRPSLGEKFSVGQLYCAYNDSFLPRNLCGFGDNVKPVYIASSDVSNTQWSVTETDDIKERVSQLGLSPELTASFLSDMVTTKGSALYLTRTKPSYRTYEASVICTITTRNEKLKLDAPDLIDALPEEPIETTKATHVICGVQFGMTTVITARTKASGSGSAEDIKVVLASLNPPLPGGSSASSSLEDLKKLAAMLEFDIISDRVELNARGINYEEVFTTARSLVDEVKKVNKGKGYRAIYELKPLAEVAKMLKLDVKSEPLISVNKSCLDRFAPLFENFSASKQQLDDYLAKIQNYNACIPPSQVSDADRQVKDIDDFVENLKSKLSKALSSVRNGSRPVTELGKHLTSAESDLNSKFNTNSSSSVVRQYTDKMAFYDMLNLGQVNYIADDYDGLKVDIVDKIAKDYGDKKVYILYFNARSTSILLWTGTRDHILQLIRTKASDYEVVLVDCDLAGKRPLSEPRVELRRGGEILTYNVLGDVYDLADKALLHCAHPTGIEKVTGLIPPIDLKPMKIPCPGPQCKSSLTLEWVCPDCKDTVCFNAKDACMYCSCGKYKNAEAEFTCKNATHGANYTTASDSAKFLKALKGLKPYEEFNILILGETGIGKSTFINMFLNFLIFDTLEEACTYPGPLRCAIPGGFVTELKDDKGYKIQDISVSFGTKNPKEHESSKGQSATQEASAYSFVINGKVIRLIDTPGIGDTRGLTQDYANIDNIMKLLQSVDKLSAILFLLDPNEARLTTTFDFCLTELLTHLHKNSTKNLVFGFPRARGTSFQLGDTRAPLLELLEVKNTGVSILDEQNTFFFDGDCFKHLAIFKQEKIIMPDRADCIKSWNASRDNIRRLMKRTIELPTHAVAETLTLNRTRTIVLNMTDPMIKISQAISTTKARIQERLDKIKEAQAKGESLKGLLELTKVEVVSEPLKDPRTVCASGECQKTVHDEISNLSTLVYTTICHDQCQIDCPDGTLGVPQLQSCAAFQNLICTTCKHEWNFHLHIRYNTKTVSKKIPDLGNVNALLGAQKEEEAQKIFKQQAEEILKKYTNAEKVINESLALFGVYLYKESTMTYNDATIAYLDNLASLASKEGKLEKAREFIARKEAYQQQRDKIMTAINKKDQSQPDETSLDKTFQKLTQLEEVGNQFSQIIGPVVLVATPDTSTVRLKTQPTGTFKYTWFNPSSLRQTVIH